MIRNKVSFNGEYFAHCGRCDNKIMGLKFVDQVLKYDNENYFIVEEENFSKSIIIASQPKINRTYMYTKDIRCRNCNVVIGQKINASNIDTIDLIDKIIILVNSLTIFQGKENLTTKLRNQFDTYFQEQTMELEQQINSSLQLPLSQQSREQTIAIVQKSNMMKDQKINQSQETMNKEDSEYMVKNKIQQNKIININMKGIKRQQPCSEDTNEYTIEANRNFLFFANVLDKIDRRVGELAHVGNVLTKKLQCQLKKKQI